MKNIIYSFSIFAICIFLIHLKAPEWMLALAMVISLFLFYVAQKKEKENDDIKIIFRFLILVFVALGYIFGLLFNFNLRLIPEGMLLAVAIFFIVGFFEIKLQKILFKIKKNIFILNKDEFPYFALGVALSIALRST